ncbi:alpha/beta hydrolase [Nocardia nepalensis]|uniref:alpha/beta hydrolase n=1 Tax=Nocardia nepalensis TaxID=3375448 RepID=UPI003B671767
MPRIRRTLFENLPLPMKKAAVQTMLGLPRPIRRIIAGPAARIDGQEQDLDAQLVTRLMRVSGMELFGGPIDRARAHTDEGATVMGGTLAGPDMGIREITIPATGYDIPATLYSPAGLPDEVGLLVFYHGGGWSVGSRHSHEPVARFLAVHAGVRVLSIEYRLAPENPFPAAVDDAVTAFGYAHAHAGEIGADPARIAVGGDSAGGNLAAVVAQCTTAGGGPSPAFQLLLYPATDLGARTASRRLFAAGFLLTADDIRWANTNYLPDGAELTDPRLSPLHGDPAGVAPAYIATAGFDPLRDEGDSYAEKLAAAGVAVIHDRYPDLPHGYLNFLGIGGRAHQAALAAAHALETGLAEGN